MRVKLLIAMLLTLTSPAVVRASGKKFAPKINLRFINGSAGLKANPNIKPISFFGGIDAAVYFYINPYSAFGVGYTFVANLAGSSVPLQGANLTYRNHFVNQGTRVGYDDEFGIMSEQALWTMYWSIGLGNRAYFFQSTSSTRGSVSGASTYVQPGIGADFNFGKNWELNFELGMPLMSFASSSAGGLGGFFFYAGTNYYW